MVRHLGLLSLWLVGAAGADTFDDFFRALVQVESGGRTNVVGDQGRSFGPAQISRAYFQDARTVDPNLKWEDVYSIEGSKKVFKAYMRRWKVPEGDFERMARIHNGGPKGDQKDATVPYWKRVQRAWRTATGKTLLPSRIEGTTAP